MPTVTPKYVLNGYLVLSSVIKYLVDPTLFFTNSHMFAFIRMEI